MAVSFSKKNPKLVKDNLQLENQNGKPSYLDAVQGNKRNGQTRLLPWFNHMILQNSLNVQPFLILFKQKFFTNETSFPFYDRISDIQSIMKPNNGATEIDSPNFKSQLGVRTRNGIW